MPRPRHPRRIRKRPRRRRYQRLAVRVPGEGAKLSADSEALLETVTAKWIAWDLGPVTIQSYTKWSRRLLAWLDRRGVAPTQIRTEHLEAWAPTLVPP